MRYPVHWVAHSASPYNACLFRALAADPGIDFTVHFMHGYPGDRPWRGSMTDGFRSHECRRTAGICWDLVRLAATDKRSLFVTGNWSEPTILLSLTLLAARRRPFVMWTGTPDMEKRRNPVKAYLRLAWLRQMFARATRVMGTGTPALKNLARMGCPTDKLVNFPLCVPLNGYLPRGELARGSADRCLLRLVSVGRVIHSIKGHDIAVEALAKARDLAGRDDFEYRIAGSGVDLDALRQQVHQLGLDGRVIFLGWLEPERVHDLYRDSDVLLHPSRVDAFGAAVLEAMAAGLVVLGSEATAAVRDRIRHGENGFVHPTGDLDELARQIGHLLTHPGIIPNIGRQARRTAEEWPVERGVQSVKTILAEISAAGGPRRLQEDKPPEADGPGLKGHGGR